MKASRRVTVVRWILRAALLINMLFLTETAFLFYSLNALAGSDAFRPSSAEQVSRLAAPYQLHTRETDGMFRIVQQQHSELEVMFSALGTSDEIAQRLSLFSTLGFAVLLLSLFGCLVALPTCAQQLEVASRDA